jgi:hypothetical protein
VENHGFVLGPMAIKPVNQHDTIMLPATLTTLVDFTRRIGIDLCGSSFTLDAGFDSKDNKDAIKAHKMQPVISPTVATRRRQSPLLGSSGGLIEPSITSAIKWSGPLDGKTPIANWR